MCIKSVYGNYKKKDMEVQDFKNLARYFKNVEYIVLEGWGEPLIHPSLIDIIRIAKSEGPKVGFVTSGYGLTKDYANALLESGIDFLGFSLSGAKASTHERIRVNSSFEEIEEGIRNICELSKTTKRYPKIHIVYLLLKENVEESPLIVELAKRLGLKEIVFINMIQISDLWQDSIKAFTYEKENPWEKVLQEAKRIASSYGIKVKVPSLTKSDVAICSENPLNCLYVSVDGDVSPCVYLNPPIPSPFVRIFEGKLCETRRLVFGNIFQEPLEVLWNKRDYVEFREAHKKRQTLLKNMLDDLFSFRLDSIHTLFTVPDACRTCHKMYGF